jgi:glycosyltransferase involved in cell wall biosynthesis
MKVSVIIPTIKRPTLKEAVESVKNQTFKDFELIIVEDKKHQGIAKTLNAGTRKAKGKYIAILADDDSWISKDKLERQVEFLDKHKDYILVGTNSIAIDKTGKEIARFAGNGFPDHSSVLYRKEAGEYSEDLKRAIDLDFFLRIRKLGKFGFMPDCFIKYREDSDTKDVVKKRQEDSFWCLKVFLRHKVWKEYPKAVIRYLVFSLLKVFPEPYYLYRKIKYE